METKCPFSNKNCRNHGCKLFKTDYREYTGQLEPKKIEDCIFNVIYDELVNMNRRNAMIHSEIGETKNANIFQAVAMLCDSEKAKSELLKMIKKHIPNVELLE